MDKEYDRHKRIVVNGAASGIGAAVADALVRRGAEVIGLDRREGAVALAAHIAVDLADPGSIDAAVARVGGRVDALFNCAGLSPMQPSLPVIAVNFLGTRHLTHAVAALMGDRGAIVSVSSNGGLGWRERVAPLRDFIATPDFASGLQWAERHAEEIGNAYRFAKEALTMWTMSASARFIARGIRINCTSPGAVATPMLAEVEEQVPAAVIDRTAAQIGRRSSPEEQALPLLFLNSDAASYINGIDLPVDGGFSAALALDAAIGRA